MSAKRSILAVALAVILVFAGSAFGEIGENLTGNYQGTFIGDDYGWFKVDVNPDGSITGTVHSNVSYLDMEVQGTCDFNGECEFMTTGYELVPYYFLGKIDFMNRLIGKWAYSDQSGRGSFYGIIQRE